MPATLRSRPRRAATFAATWILACAHVGTALAAPTLPPLADPPTGQHIVGKFIWFDLATADTAAASRFYRAVFGWTVESVAGSAERYAVIRNDGRPIGGVFRPPVPKGKPSGARWLAFASVEKLDRAVGAMTDVGATVLVAPTLVAGRGAHAILRDAQGAIVGLLQSASGDPPDQPVAPGEFFWVDLFARDPAKAADTYGQLGFEVAPDETSGVAGRRLLVSAGYARAGIMALPPGGREPGWLPYVQVEDVAATLARVRAAGGKVLREPDAALLGGGVAVIGDPQGGILGIIHWPSAADAETQP
jgi:predicted enzyme related to lactoylglutathione lyase